MKRRETFFKFVRVNEEERQARLERRRRAAEQVRKALRAQEEASVVERPLRRFGCKMMVRWSGPHMVHSNTVRLPRGALPRSGVGHRSW